MDNNYIITDGNRAIRTKHGVESCPIQQAQVFDRKKARNVLTSLPKPLRQFGFKIQEIQIDSNIFKEGVEKAIEIHSEPVQKTTKVFQEEGKTVLESPVKPNDQIKMWVDQMNNLAVIIENANKRMDQLRDEYRSIDHQRVNLEHEIELLNGKYGKGLSACEGYKKYKELRECLIRRREIKDEKMVVKQFIDNTKHINTENVACVVEGLSHRKFTFR
ncbi:MAG: hypothetical protein [Bacteriophage sp.]|nr:MAG: hypothetical protein [Bacteriophage sp.]